MPTLSQADKDAIALMMRLIGTLQGQWYALGSRRHSAVTTLQSACYYLYTGSPLHSDLKREV